MVASRAQRIELGPEQDFPLGALDNGNIDPVHTVAELLPEGFARYLRVFHPFLPADPRDPKKTLPGPVRTWRSLAEEVGAVYHPEIMSWTLIDALGGELEENRPYWVSEGRLREPAKSALFDVLGGGDKHDVHFLYSLVAIVRGDSPLLFRAPLQEHQLVHATASKLLRHDREERDDVAGPEFVWPEDRSWVFNTDYDLESSYVACGDEMAERILTNASIEALPVSRSMRVDRGADTVNAARGR